jgi:hypothetical protein
MIACIDIHSGPDKDGKYLYTKTWIDPSPAGCSSCGAEMNYATGEPVCLKCGATGPQTKGQVFRDVLR